MCFLWTVIRILVEMSDVFQMKVEFKIVDEIQRP